MVSAENRKKSWTLTLIALVTIVESFLSEAATDIIHPACGTGWFIADITQRRDSHCWETDDILLEAEVENKGIISRYKHNYLVSISKGYHGYVFRQQRGRLQVIKTHKINLLAPELFF